MTEASALTPGMTTPYVCTNRTYSYVPINDMTKAARPPTASSVDRTCRSKEAGPDGTVGRRGRLQDFCSLGWVSVEGAGCRLQRREHVS